MQHKTVNFTDLLLEHFWRCRMLCEKCGVRRLLTAGAHYLFTLIPEPLKPISCMLCPAGGRPHPGVGGRHHERVQQGGRRLAGQRLRRPRGNAIGEPLPLPATRACGAWLHNVQTALLAALSDAGAAWFAAMHAAPQMQVLLQASAQFLACGGGQRGLIAPLLHA